MEPRNYVRKPFVVEAVQVTEENLQQVEQWCDGSTQTEPRGDEGRSVTWINVDVRNPLTKRQTQAFVGDWVLKGKRGFKVYTDKAFGENFNPELSAADYSAQAVLADKIVTSLQGSKYPIPTAFDVIGVDGDK